MKSILREMIRAILHFFFRYFHQLQVQGLRNVPPTGPAVLLANHGSYYDPVMLRTLIRRRVCFMTWREVLRWPVVGWAARKLGAFPVDLSRRKDKAAIRAALEVLRRGEILGIFPEGQRAIGPFLDEGKTGGVYLALRAGAPIVPVSIVGTHDVWPRRRRFPQPGRIAITFHPPLQFGALSLGSRTREREFVEKVMERLRCVINAEIEARLRAWMAMGFTGASVGRLRAKTGATS